MSGDPCVSSEIARPCVVCEGSGCSWLTTDEDRQGEPVWRRFLCSACDGTGTRWPSWTSTNQPKKGPS